MNERDAFVIFISGIRSAEEAARHLALARDQGEWLKVQLALEGVRELATKLATRSTRPLILTPKDLRLQ